MCELLTKFFFYLRGSCLLLCLEFGIAQMFAGISYGGRDSSGRMFNNPAAQTLLNLSNGRRYVDFNVIGQLRLSGIDMRLQGTPQEKF